MDLAGEAARAGDAGDSMAMMVVAFAHLNGDGTEKDAALAVKWFRKAADAGHPMGMQALAFMYRDGEGVERNPDEAQRWMKKAEATKRALQMRQQQRGRGSATANSGRD